MAFDSIVAPIYFIRDISRPEIGITDRINDENGQKSHDTRKNQFGVTGRSANVIKGKDESLIFLRDGIILVRQAALNYPETVEATI